MLGWASQKKIPPPKYFPDRPLDKALVDYINKNGVERALPPLDSESQKRLEEMGLKEIDIHITGLTSQVEECVKDKEFLQFEEGQLIESTRTSFDHWVNRARNKGLSERDIEVRIFMRSPKLLSLFKQKKIFNKRDFSDYDDSLIAMSKRIVDYYDVSDAIMGALEAGEMEYYELETPDLVEYFLFNSFYTGDHKVIKTFIDLGVDAPIYLCNSSCRSG